MRRKNACPLYPNSDRKSEFPQTVMSALRDVRFGPEADMRRRDLRELAET